MVESGASRTFETQFTFAQALTEAARAVPGVLVVISLPESEIETGGEAGRFALERLRNVVARVQSPWRPATMAESFEIVRRRLFEEIPSESVARRDAVVRAFSEMYRSQTGDFPSQCREGEYRRQLEACYPIHPSLFEQLYSKWSTLDKFQRTRGVLRLMAKVIHALWEGGDPNLLIMPGTVAISDSDVRSELMNYLEDPWGAVIETDVDGPDSLPARIDRDIPNLGRYGASRRVARAIFLGSAPTGTAAHRGIEETDIKLGCVQPGENTAILGDALRRLTDQATHLYQQQRRFWFATQPSVIRLARDRAEQYRDDDDVDPEIVGRLRGELRTRGDFSGVHLAAAGTEVSDELDARLVILGPEYEHEPRQEVSRARAAAAEILERRGSQPRRYRNSLLFLAADESRLTELRQAVRDHLAWDSIHREADQLNLDAFQRQQAEQKVGDAAETVTSRMLETYQWLLVPNQETGAALTWDEVRLAGGDSLAVRASRRAVVDENLYVRMAGTVLRMYLDRVPLWRNGHVALRQLREDFGQYLYLPRLKDADVLLQAVADGAASLVWEQETFGYADSYDESAGRYLGLRAGQQGSVMLEGGVF